MIAGHIVAVTVLDMDDDRLHTSRFQILSANGFRDMIGNNGIVASADLQQTKIVINAIVIRHHRRPGLMVSEEVIGRHQIFGTVVFHNQHARIERMETVSGYTGAHHSGKMKAAAATGKNIVHAHQQAAEVLCKNRIAPKACSQKVIRDLCRLPLAAQLDTISAFRR